MAEKSKTAAKKPKSPDIKFRCQRCDKLNKLEDMRSVTRFNPVLVVCKSCEKEIR